ncbi:RHS repeat domain-containing protein [Paractinoplanes durhamensis]|uniref:RHS repeat domain-containing protein n=1 Tax=Paractinoplanes durhamensis TaxID=113563 RepID=UPI001940907F|nr:RHS repeat-associated core domain-containing protein [Actinoplanes durhamensis]
MTGASAADPAAPPPTKRVELTKPKRSAPAVERKAYPKFNPAGHADFPAAGTATVAAGNKSRGGLPVLVSGNRAPVTITTPGRAAAAAAGVRGLLFSLRGSGSVEVDVDAATFRNAYGGDFADRLRLVRLPACALTTPTVPACQTQTPISATLSGPVSLAATGATVLAADATVSGPAGDYSATTLSPGGTWSTGGNTGAFTYAYPITVPAAVGGAAPQISVDYNSASQDARTESTNNQSSWLGDGWSSTENYIERTYKACEDVAGSGAPAHDGDQCWAGQILTLSLNGSSTPIVYDDATHTFRPATDSATTKIENLTGATNGTANGEYFRVTEGGIQYYFGLNRLPTWAAGNEETKSAWTMPVYQAHDGVAVCSDSSTFADTACTLGYRFNLDYVVDTSSNAVAYYYDTETGYYGPNLKNTPVSYVRGGSLKRIDYGMTASTIFAATAPEQVVFTTAERCTLDCSFGTAHPEYYPDVPVDLNCDATGDCTHHSPSFWTRKRLASITTQIQVGGVTKPVDRWDFTHSFPDGGDHAPSLWLDSIQHTGLDRIGGADADASTPAITFNPIQIANRVGTLPGLPRMYHDRISNIVTETGAETDVVYRTPDCSSVPASDPADPDDVAAQAFASTNTTGCFPVYWTPEGQPRPLMDWFYTHPVTKVTTIDNNNKYQDGTQPKLVTEYSYQGNPGWHFDDNEVVKAKNRTWGQFRGYPEVDVTTGDTSVFHYTDKTQVFDRKTLSKSYYFLGMNGDRLPGGDTRSVAPLNSTDGAVTVADNDAYAGRVFESVTYTGAGGTIDSATVTVPTLIGPTASRARTGLPTLKAQMVRDAKSLTRQAVSYGWRKTETDTFYNTTLGQSTTGMAVQTDDRGEIGAAGNVAHCTFTRYLDGSVATLVVPAEITVTDQDCSSAGATATGTLLSDSRTSYDGNAFAYNGDGQSNPARPARGLVTLVQQSSAATGATATAFIDIARTTYDSYGRVTATTRTPNSTAADGTTSLAQAVYTRRSPASGALPVTVTTVTAVTPGTNCAVVTVSSKNCYLDSATLDPARLLPTAKTDMAGKLTSLTYDALGRLTAVWLPNKSKAAQAQANTTFSYTMSRTAPSVVATRSLLDSGEYAVDQTLYDALLRPLETQTTGENDSVTVSDTQYDSHGWSVLTNNAYSTAGPPTATLISDRISQVSIPQTTVTDHDAMGRVTQSTEEHNGSLTRRTRTAYTGDTLTVLPPEGAVAARTTTNARGQTTTLDHFTAAPTLSGSVTQGFSASGGTSQSIAYEYTAAGERAKLTGPDGSVWTYQYDLLRRPIAQTDPDTGYSSTRHDDAGNVVAATDARNIELDYTYDLLGRKLTATSKTTGFQYAQWTYDTLRIGKPTSSSRFVPGINGAYTVGVTGYTALGNPAGQKITLPAVEAPLPTTYSTTFAFSPNTEQVTTQTDPAVTGMSGEVITYGYDGLGAPVSTAGTNLYVSGTTYSDFAKPTRVAMGPSTNLAVAYYSYDEETLRLSGRTVDRTQGIGPRVDDTSWTYDQAGNPLSVVDKQSETGNVVTDTQCFAYNALARLVEAKTVDGNCATGTLSSGAGSYWQTYAYNPVGDRTSLIDHATGGGTDAITGYTNGCSSGCGKSGPQPHTLTATTGGTNPTAFTYDSIGNLVTRTPATGNAQTLSWDDEGNLASVASAAGTTKYVYDADGNQLIRRDPGRTTLFAGDTEVVADTSVTPAVVLGGVRSYTHGGGVVAVRSTLPGSAGTDYLFTDPHGTSALAMDVATQVVSRKQYKPYGEVRGSPNTTAWPDMTHGYLGKSTDAVTGYTDLGARKYDPALGRFISADPLLDGADVNQLGGYTYAGDNPITSADPDGLKAIDYELDDGFGRPLDRSMSDVAVSEGGRKKGQQNRQAIKKFATTVLSDAGGLVNSLNPFSCLSGGIDGCIEEAKRPYRTAMTVVHLFQCVAQKGCGALEEDIGCANSFAECAGHFTFFVISAAATGGLGAESAAARVEAGVAKADAAASAPKPHAPKTPKVVPGKPRVTLLGKLDGLTPDDPNALWRYRGNPDYNVLDLPNKGPNRYTWNRNMQFIDEALGRGDEIRLMHNPAAFKKGGGIYSKELEYLDEHYKWEKKDTYWIVQKK